MYGFRHLAAYPCTLSEHKMPAKAQAAAVRPTCAVTILVARRARADKMAEFESTSERMMATAREFPGHLGAYLVKPAEDSGVDHNLYHTVFAFESEASLSDWQVSAARARAVQELMRYTETETGYRRMTGFDHWYAMPRTLQAPRWKIAIITWLGICPTVWMAQLLMSKPLAHWPSFPRVAVTTAAVIVLMTWWIAPIMTRFFSRWLYPTQAAPTE